jgi:hypothetical protein
MTEEGYREILKKEEEKHQKKLATNINTIKNLLIAFLIIAIAGVIISVAVTDCASESSDIYAGEVTTQINNSSW